jgi:conjugal transfer pilus assembly protein TrbC
MQKQWGLGLLLMTMIGLCFANTNDDIKAYQTESTRQKQTIKHVDLVALSKASLKNKAQNQAVIDSLFSQAKGSLPANKTGGKPADGAMLFVSFSMPEPLLFALADEAARFDIPLVIKGLVDGDFKKTINTFYKLQARAQKDQLVFSGVSLDPAWFEQFDIQAVPALVLTQAPSDFKSQKASNMQPFDVVYGNASIKNGLTLIAERGDAGQALARSLLEKAHV